MPQPELPRRYNLDDLCDRLAASSLPDVLSVDTLIEAHAPISVRKGARASRPPATPEEEQEVARLVSVLRDTLFSQYGEQAEGLQPSVILRSAMIDTMPDKGPVASAIVELRSRNGQSIIGNNHRLYELEQGPALVWMRRGEGGKLELRFIFSEAAFEEELRHLARSVGSALEDPSQQPVSVSALLKFANRSVLPLSGQDMNITGLSVKEGSAGRQIELATDTGARITCEIRHDQETLGLSYRYLFRFKK